MALLVGLAAQAGCGVDKAPNFSVQVMSSALTSGVEHVFVTFDQVSVYSQERRWEVVDSSLHTIDLTAGDLNAVLATLSPGHYTEIRLHVLSGHAVINGVDTPLDIKNSKTGLKLKTDFVLGTCGVVSVAVDGGSLVTCRKNGCVLASAANVTATVDTSGCGPVCGNGQCEAPETCSTCPADCGPCPSCGDGTCNGSEDCLSCPADCGACPPRCGDGSCNGSDTCANCPEDCGPCGPVCGDGTCDPTENCNCLDCECLEPGTTCINNQCDTYCGNNTCETSRETSCSCADDCPPVCGNADCECGESCSNCAADCGQCTPVCGNGQCEPPTETVCNCPGDCGGPACGNGACDCGENASTCPGDCQASCGDNFCTHSETCSNCRFDCGRCKASDCVVGNGCGEKESCESCPGPLDCGTCTCNFDNVCDWQHEIPCTCIDDECAPRCGDGYCDCFETSCTCSADCGPCN